MQDSFSEMKQAIEKNLENAKQRNEKCANCQKKITNCRIVFSKNGKNEGPYCSGKCAENSTLKNEFGNQQVENQSTSKSVIKQITFFGLISILPLTITAIIIYLLNKKK